MPAEHSLDLNGKRATQREAQTWTIQPGDGGGIDIYISTQSVQEAAYVVA
jgi:hypothetical protein